MTVNDGDDARVTGTTMLDHRPPRKDACDARSDAVNRMPPSPMPAAGRSIPSLIVIRDLPDLHAEPIYTALLPLISAHHYLPLPSLIEYEHYPVHISQSLAGI